MENLERFVMPLTIGAAVLGVWAALRNRNVAPVNVTVAAPQPSAASLYSSIADETGAAGGGFGTSAAYVAAGYASPQVQAPIQTAAAPVTATGSGKQGSPRWRAGYTQGLPLRYTSNLPPWKNAHMARIATDEPSGFTGGNGGGGGGRGRGGGCGCGCGGGGDCVGCSAAAYRQQGYGSPNPNIFLDGAGGNFVPIHTAPTIPPGSVDNAAGWQRQWRIKSPNEHGAEPDFNWGN